LCTCWSHLSIQFNRGKLYRVEDAAVILEYILKLREEKLGTANPEVADEKKRLAVLLKEAGRARIRKGNSLVNLLDSSS